MAPKYLLPTPEDNAGIVTRRLEAGESVDMAGTPVTLANMVLPGHRICVKPIRQGESLLSWGLPFGTALCDIAPGDYLCNAKGRDVLRMRNPEDYGDTLKVNFTDRDTVAERILPEAPVYGHNQPDIDDGLTFDGYYRGKERGWGTRNYLVVIGATSRTRSAVLEAARQLQARYPAGDQFDGVVPVVHTEGGGIGQPNNLPLLLRTLAGFALNPNAGAAILVDDGRGPVTQAALGEALRDSPIPQDEYTVRCVAADTGSPQEDIDRICEVAIALMPDVEAVKRQPAPLSGIRLGLQCGGSDAFSGVTANQVLGKAVQQLIRRGGTANLAETDELIGAEQFVLQRVGDRGVYDAFLNVQQRFKDYAQTHGNTAEGNVSGGNIYRGLYNITLKSLGAARKKDPSTFIDRVIEYGEPMLSPGYYFMDSPGNDLESIAGQVAAGANLILFTTGNGSITNFPYVPTIKIVTTNERYQLLASDMDFNAGQVLDGVSMDDVAQSLFDSVLRASSGERTKGERTGQYQTQIWRNWYIPAGQRRPLDGAATIEPANGVPLIAAARRPSPLASADRLRRFALILPTSLCSGQVAEQIATRVNTTRSDDDAQSPVVALPHTEGCGVSGGNAEEIFRDTLIGYATHPAIDTCVFLEHGCEKTHNDYFRTALDKKGIDAERFHWASIQLEGGIGAVSQHVQSVLTQPAADAQVADRPVHIGLAASQRTHAADARVLGQFAGSLLDSGAGVVLASNDPLLQFPEFLQALGLDSVHPTLRYSQQIDHAGLHIMDSSSTDWLEIATGLGACGCEALVVAPARGPWQAHRFLPTLQVGLGDNDSTQMDLRVEASIAAEQLTELLARTLSGAYTPKSRPAPNVGFQVSRGRYGVSL